ncbi:hypothetical protein FIV42_12175 [Persicimonas caeni]|uniref:EF-hand domain-containing protein n=1 Tax=Persicimonas caeni TaxID=2292766 RepID=A0A4Y6PT14_PERCE|nr:hypothetical protein [Persicimonas caeni]QDG51474.1 hypothetical protein FIV42_12175 [Persicimonas caeni]QED32695.1 hypothetical protein FRD00_12170 [Persicimonas caeni]
MSYRRRSILIGSLLLASSLVACTEDAPGGSDNNDWDVGGGDVLGGSDADGSADAVSDDAGIDAAEDAGAQTPFSAEGLASAPWYAMVPLTTDPAVTGTVYKLTFDTEMNVAIGFREEVTGSWSIFGDDRVRLSQLENEGQPNRPEQLLLDADLDGDGNIDALELVVPQENGEPFVLRFEQPGTPAVSVEEIAGNWQSDETYTDENGNDFRFALRALGGTLGYGIYNGAYVEFISGEAITITYDTGETYWFSAPPASGDPQPPLGGQIVVDDAGEMVLYAPRETAPNSDEFEAMRMRSVDGFSL